MSYLVRVLNNPNVKIIYYNKSDYCLFLIPQEERSNFFNNKKLKLRYDYDGSECDFSTSLLNFFKTTLDLNNEDAIKFVYESDVYDGKYQYYERSAYHYHSAKKAFWQLVNSNFIRDEKLGLFDIFLLERKLLPLKVPQEKQNKRDILTYTVIIEYQKKQIAHATKILNEYESKLKSITS